MEYFELTKCLTLAMMKNAPVKVAVLALGNTARARAHEAATKDTTGANAVFVPKFTRSVFTE